MKYLKSIFLFVAFSALLTGCDSDFLERYPLDQVTEPDFFLKAGDLQIFMNRFYNTSNFPVMTSTSRPGDGGADDLNSDLMVGQELHARLIGNRSVGSSVNISWNFNDIRTINYFFANYERCEDDISAYKQYLGEAYFFRALLYFRLLRQFGDVQWYTIVLGTSSPELYDPRTPRHIVVDNILADLDQAVNYLSEAKGSGYERINKWIALLIQSRIALYEGTWHKYHNGTVFAPAVSDPNKYLNKAVQAAEAVINSGLYNVYQSAGGGDPDMDYYRLFGMLDLTNNSEVMFWQRYSVAQGLPSTCMFYNNELPINRGITKAMADSYLCKDGNPISVSPLFQGWNTLSDEAKNRDPRFEQTIFTPEAVWQQTGDDIIYWQSAYELMNSNSRYFAPTGYCHRKIYNENMQYHSTSTEEWPLIIYRYAEVLLNFAEAKAELGPISQADLDKSINKLRDRVGMPHLTVDNITDDPDWPFKNISPILNEIRRERCVELVNEGFRWYDIQRWAAAGELIVGKRPKGAKAAQFPAEFLNWAVDADGFLDPYQVAIPNGFQFRLDRDYLDPIPETQMILNPALTQNPNWTQ